MTGAQRTTRSRVPLLSPNAKICTISSEGTLMLQTTKRIFGLHMAQSKRSWWITRNSGELAAHIFWRRRSIFPMHRNIKKMVFTCLERKISKRLWLTSLSRKQNLTDLEQYDTLNSDICFLKEQCKTKAHCKQLYQWLALEMRFLVSLDAIAQYQ